MTWVQSVDRPDKSPVDVGSIQTHCPGCRVYSRKNKLHCWYRVQDSDGLDRLEATSSVIQSDQSKVTFIAGGLAWSLSFHTSSVGDWIHWQRTSIEPVPADIRHKSDGPVTSIGYMAYLWEMFESNNLWLSAKQLLLASWRSKTSKVYDSHFKKRLAWCTERACNHITGLIPDVANSLADLDSQDQTSSLDAYWSIVSSVHDRVDDIDLGSIH